MSAEAAAHRVVIVEDHPVVRDGLVRVLDAEENLRVVGTAADSKTAMKLLASASPDLVIVDLSLGTESGLELIKAIRTENSRVAVLVLSMHDDAVFAERALRAGARGYVNKREATEAFLNAVHRILGGEVWLSPRASSILLEGLVTRRVDHGQSRAGHLSDREIEVLHLLGAGVSTREIATKLHIIVKTVESHRANLKEKLGLQTGTELVAYAAKWASGGS